MDRLSDAIRGELRRFGPQAGLAEILERWPAAVGPAISRNAWPARVGRDGTLHINTADSVWAFELAHRGPEIAERLGVTAVRFAPGPLAVDEPEAARPLGPEPTVAQTEEAIRIAAAIGDENLRKSVERAVSLGLARGPVGRPL
jgi:hypothetical protein